MSLRCVHPSEDAVLSAMSRLGGHKTGHRTTGDFAAEVSEAANSIKAKEKDGGRDRDRTGDPLLAKQVLSQLSYTPTVGTTFILKHFRGFQNPFLRFSSVTVPKLYQNPCLQGAVCAAGYGFFPLCGQRTLTFVAGRKRNAD
jgi:hypothetical protein